MHGMIGNSTVRQRCIVRRHSDWTLKEHEVVVSHWPDVSEIARRMPYRSERAIRAFAGRCNLTTPRHTWTAAQDSKLRKLAAAGLPRKEIAAEIGLGVGQVAGRLNYCKIHVARRPPAPSSDPLVDAVRQRAFEMDLSLADLDRSLGNRKIFQQASGQQRVKLAHVERAIKALGGQLVAKWPVQ